jgi:Photosynthesis system II assembly factor YCF48
VKKQPQETADEKMLGKVIAAELRQQLAAAESDCPETETVAAFYDRTLSDAERALWENHFLKCLRCQEYLAELARLSDADEPPSVLGEQAEAEPTEASPGWFYRLAWAIPFLIIGLSSAVWYREDIQRFLELHQETAMNAPAPPLPADQPPEESTARDEEGRAKAEKDLAKATPVPAVVPAKNKMGAGQNASSSMVAQSRTAASGGMAAPSARADLRDAAKMPEPAPKSEVAEKKNSDYVVPIVPAAPPAAPARENAPTEAESAAVHKGMSQLSGLTIRGAQQKAVTKWRVGRRGTIQKADESGGWTRIVSGTDDDLFDITFAETTGWAVGHSGVVLRSTDGGNTWQRVAAPTSEDLIHVSSQGAQQAQVIARSGKSFSTTDGGQNWK